MREFESAPPEVQAILGRRIDQLGLKLEGSPVERFVLQLQEELRRKGLKKFQAVCYLTDEWGCPDQEPIIGIPFYLADPKLAILEKEMNDLEDAREIMMYLRHEAGHAFNYAYRLYATPEWRELFGPFNRRYREHYRPVPFSRRYVRHMEGWYAQKHPDEDFAETFAVWLTPASGWRQRYRGWPALEKLKYVHRTCRELRDREPTVGSGKTDLTVAQMRVTVEQFYRKMARQNRTAVDVVMDGDLLDIFGKPRRRKVGLRPAAEIVQEHREALTDKIAYWTGVRRPIVRGLVEAVIGHCERQKLDGDPAKASAYLVELTAYGTVLAMNYLTRGRFVLK
ncbi:MAG TPA: putative zinc-binding metallopeptidase [Candidatus Polarisedimenticolia bacterium]|nr:putative zinc-binding metallopeptidase [Candidatus Polarisedimenticolia bacterium]